MPDTNVILASEKTTSPTSPNKEYIALWQKGYFDLLFSRDTLREYIKKLRAAGIERARIVQFVISIRELGKSVPIQLCHLPQYPLDTDDIAFVLCADNGKATHLLSYDSDLDPLKGTYSFKICQPLEFLFELRESLHRSS